MSAASKNKTAIMTAVHMQIIEWNDARSNLNKAGNMAELVACDWALGH